MFVLCVAIFFNISFLCRYSVDINFEKSVVNKDAFRDPALKRKARRDVKAKFEERLVVIVLLFFWWVFFLWSELGSAVGKLMQDMFGGYTLRSVDASLV